MALTDDPSQASRTFGHGLCSTGKYRYDTRPAADRALKAFTRKEHGRCSIYRCEECHGWHLGKTHGRCR